MGTLNPKGQLQPQPAVGPEKDRFEAARGKADVPWRTADLMALLRSHHGRSRRNRSITW